MSLAKNDTEPTQNARHASRTTQYALLIPILLVALFLRTHRLVEVPAGVDYDEAGNLILAGEIAAGQSAPVFIRAYAGREAVFYWLAAGTMRLLGRSLLALRLTSALCGVGAVLASWFLAREMFHPGEDGQESPESTWIPPLTAALMAVSYWQVHVNRYGFRVNAMVVLLTASVALLWRGLRRSHWPTLVAAGLLCGLSANTYLAVRAFPLVLIVFAVWVIFTWGVTRRRMPGAPSNVKRHASSVVGRLSSFVRFQQFALFTLTTLVTLAPLIVFFLQNPQYFSTRMSQTSIFDPAIHEGDLWGTLGRVTLQALGVFTVRGDGNPVYNYNYSPILGPVLGACFYVGLLLAAWRLVRYKPGYESTPYLLLLAWLPVMLVPNVLGARGVPHSLRSMGLAPAVFIVAALGVQGVVRAAWSEIVQAFVRPSRARPSFSPPRADRSPPAGIAGGQIAGLALIATLILVTVGRQTYQRYFHLWTQDPGAYLKGAADLRHAAEYLNNWDAGQTTIFVGNDTYRHTTIAAFSENYEQVKWINGPALVIPVGSERPALYVFDHTNPLDPVLARYIPDETLQEREVGPDGSLGFEAYLLPPDQPSPLPRIAGQGRLGDALTFLGHDLGQTAYGGGTLDVTLYWRVERAVAQEDWTFFAHLVDARGFRWGGETFFHYPSGQWAPGEVILFRQQIPVDPGAPPGGYTLNVGVFSPSLDARLPALDANGQLAGTTVHVTPIYLARAPALPERWPAMQQRLDVPLNRALTLLGSDRDRSDLRPGETLALTLHWQLQAALEKPHGLRVWIENEGMPVPLWSGDPVQGDYPLTRWQPPEYVRDRYALRLPLETVPGDYELRVALAVPGDAPARGDSSLGVSLGTIHVHASDRIWEPPPVEHEVGARLGAQPEAVVELVGYTLRLPEGTLSVKPGDTLHLTLVWRCLAPMETGYTVFTHLLDEAQQIRGQQDNPPVGGRYPTPLWVPGEVVVDEYALVIQPDAPTGQAVIEVGMYDPNTLVRLPVLDPSGATGDRVLLGDIRIDKGRTTKDE